MTSEVQNERIKLKRMEILFDDFDNVIEVGKSIFISLVTLCFIVV